MGQRMGTGVLVWRGTRGWAGEAKQGRSGTQGNFPSLSVCHGTKLPPYLAEKHLHDDCTAQHGDNPCPCSFGAWDGACGDELAVVAGMWQGLGGPTGCQEVPPACARHPTAGGGHAGQDPQSQPYPTPLSRYLCHLSLPTHPSPREPPENQLSAAGCYKPDTGVPGQHARPVLADHTLPVSASPLPAPACASPPWEMGWLGACPCCAGGLLRLPGDRLGAELLLQVSGALYGLWASF